MADSSYSSTSVFSGDNATFKVENGTVKVGRWTPPQYGKVLAVNKDLWFDELDDAMREAVIRAGFVRMIHAKKEHMRLTVNEASAAPHALDTARNNGRGRVAATAAAAPRRAHAAAATAPHAAAAARSAAADGGAAAPAAGAAAKAADTTVAGFAGAAASEGVEVRTVMMR